MNMNSSPCHMLEGVLGEGCSTAVIQRLIIGRGTGCWVSRSLACRRGGPAWSLVCRLSKERESSWVEYLTIMLLYFILYYLRHVLIWKSVRPCF